MFQRRRNQIEAIFVNLTKLDGAYEIHVCNAAIAIAQIAPSKNPRAAPPLSETIARKQRFELNPGVLVGQCPKVHLTCRPSLGEVFACERRIGVATDRPVKRFPDTSALGRGSRC